MRKLFLILAIVGIVALLIGFYPAWAEKPVKDGAGAMAIRLDTRLAAPEYHSPLDYWQTHHMDVLNRGDLTQADCLYCHQPETSCNNCHRYVGVGAIER